MSEVAEADATTYLETLLRAGLGIPPGDYWCPDGLSVPGDYPERACRAGRKPDPVTGGHWLAADLDAPPRLRWRYGWAELCGYIKATRACAPDGILGFGVDGKSLLRADHCRNLTVSGFSAGFGDPADVAGDSLGNWL